ncbi:hypothetical protein D3C73_1563160 [compost metagenome]
MLSTTNIADGPAVGARFPALSFAVPAAILIPSVPSPLIPTKVTVLVVPFPLI